MNCGYKALFSILSVITILCFSTITHAQDTLQRFDVIDVIKAFKPTLSEVIKIQSNPNPEIPEVKPISYTYTLPEIKHDDVPTVYTIRPLSLGTALLPKLKNNYTRLGYGNYNTPLFETYLNTTRNRNYQAGIYYKHLSSNVEGDRSFSNNTASAYGKRFVNKGVIDGEVFFNRNVVNLYGYEQPVTPPGIRNQYLLYEVKGGYANVVKDTSKLSYKINARYYNFNANFGSKENDFLLDGKFHKSIQGNPLDVYTAVQINNNTSTTAADYNRVFVDINPTYRLNIGRSYLMLGFNSTFFNDTVGTKFHFFPKSELGYSLIPNALTVYVGITGGLQRHTLRSISFENPFIRNIGFQNTLNQFEMYGGLKGLISPQTSFILQASYATVKNMMFYVADSALYSQQTFYDNSNAGLFIIKAELNHEFGEQFRFGFAMNYFGYDLSIAAPFSRPTFTTSVNMLYNIGNKFNIRSEIYTMNARTVRELPSGNDDTLKGLVDLNIGLDYRYNKSVMIFLNLNNLTNNQYQRWLNLPVYGLNVIGGLAVTF